MDSETPAELTSDFLEEARRRREKAKDYPDPRNLEAAERHDRLALWALRWPQQTITKAHEVVTTDWGIEFIGYHAVEIWSQMQLDVWFHSYPKKAEAMLLNYIKALQESNKEMELTEEPVPHRLIMTR